MVDFEKVSDLIFENIKKVLYPQEWIAIDLEFSKTELFTLFFVDKNKEVIMSKIAEFTGISMSTANGIVERLVKNGYLMRDRSEKDRRIVVVRLSDKGKAIIDSLKSKVFEYIELIYKALDDEEKRVIFKVFNKIMALIENKNSINQSETESSSIKKIKIE